MNKKILILAEKPSLAKKIASALDKKIKKNKYGFFENDEVIVANLVGHVLRKKIPKTYWKIENLPFNFDNLELEKIPGKEKIVSALISNINRDDIGEICSAGDPDEEGSLLVKEILDYSNVFKNRKELEFSRMWILSYNPSSIKKSFEERYDLEKDKPWSDAAEARGFADLYVGYNFSALFSLISNKQYAIGRVMTPTINLVRKREMEIENFVSEQYFIINGTFGFKDDKFEAKYTCSQNKKLEKIPSKYIKEVEKNLEEKEFVVKENKTIPKKIYPDYLPNGALLLKEMSKRFKLKAAKVTEDLQFLYENDFCSYPRSEERFLPPDMKDIFNDIYLHYLNDEEFSKYGNHFDPKNKRVFDADKSHPHYAITPLIKSKEEIEQLSSSQFKIFNFIREQFMLIFMKPYLYDETSILLENNKGSVFRIIGKIEREKGFKEYLYDRNTSKDKKEVILPDINKGDTVILNKFKKEEKWMKPPKLLKESDLVNYMENINKVYINELEYEEKEKDDSEIFKEKFSLGTPATRSGIIEKNYKKEFIKNTKEGLITNEVAKQLLIDTGKYISIEMTANFEKNMAKIVTEDMTATDFKKDITNYVNDVINKNKDKYIPKQKAVETGELCPKCNSPLVKTKTKNGEDITYCSSYPDCKFVKFKEVGKNCPQCNSPLVERRSKTGNIFIACSNYPDCKYIENNYKKTGELCPKCNHDLVEKTNKNGNKFVACSNYPDCKYIKSNFEKSDKKCEKCGKDMIVRSGKNGKFLACSGYPDCKNTVNID